MAEAKTFGEAALTSVAVLQEQLMKDSQTLAREGDHKRAFLQTFRRWESLFKRKDGDVQSDKWMVAEYYDSLKFLSEGGFDSLTKLLKENCIFFPTIKECLDFTRPDRYDYSNPFRAGPLLASPSGERSPLIEGSVQGLVQVRGE